MELGTTFLPDAGGSQLRVVISDPNVDADQVLIVSLTTATDDKDGSCIFDRGAHSMVTHATCVDYRRARIVKRAELHAGKDSGVFKVQDPASAAMLRAIYDGAGRSDFLRAAARDLLVRQGFVAPPATAPD